MSLVVGLLAGACMVAVAQPSGTSERPQAPDSDEQRIADLDLASRISSTRVSRLWTRTVRPLKIRTLFHAALPPGLVTASDIVEPMPTAWRSIPAFTAKSAEFARRGAVVHSHSPAVIRSACRTSAAAVLHMAISSDAFQSSTTECLEG
jgi:hypothetical protein